MSVCRRGRHTTDRAHDQGHGTATPTRTAHDDARSPGLQHPPVAARRSRINFPIRARALNPVPAEQAAASGEISPSGDNGSTGSGGGSSTGNGDGGDDGGDDGGAGDSGGADGD
jgi:hypothetical protein